MSERTEAFCLRRSEVEIAWPQIQILLERIDDPTFSPEEVKDQLESGHCLLWGMKEGETIKSAWVTKIESNASWKWGLIWLCAGDDVEAIVEQYEAHTEPYFKAQGCDFAQIVGRRGWLKKLPQYEETGTVMVKKLWAD